VSVLLVLRIQSELLNLVYNYAMHANSVDVILPVIYSNRAQLYSLELLLIYRQIYYVSVY